MVPKCCARAFTRVVFPAPSFPVKVITRLSPNWLMIVCAVLGNACRLGMLIVTVYNFMGDKCAVAFVEQ